MISAAEQSPDPLVVDIVSDEAPWWEIVAAFGPIAILLAAVITGIIAWMNLKHRREAERRAEWWHRAQWALEAVTPDELARKKHGMAVLNNLARSDLAGKEEAEIFQTAWRIILTESEEEPANTRNRGRWGRHTRQ